MAPCCTDTVTPKMIKKGQVKIGDKIHLEDILPETLSSEPASALLQTAAAAPQNIMTNAAQENTAPAASSGRQSGPAANVNPYTVQMPIGLKDMTAYMDQVTYTDINGTQMITVPESPMTPQDYEETIEAASVQAYAGFLRTQMGRYMRIEQLIGSSVIEDRYGFLVGVGTNFILLQEITTGNLMVIDLFSVKLTYIYYSDPVLPNFVK